MKEMWIKIGLPGADPQLGTLQGRICRESFTHSDDDVIADLPSELDEATQKNEPVRLFNPIIFRAQRDQQGNVLLGALNLAESMPNIEGDYLTLNPSNIVWWAKIEETENWKNVVASAIHHIEIATGDVPDFDALKVPTPPKGPRLVK